MNSYYVQDNIETPVSTIQYIHDLEQTIELDEIRIKELESIICSNFKDMTIMERIRVTEISSDIARMMIEEKEHKILASLDEKNNV